MPTRTVDAVLAHALSRPPTLGAGHLVCVDGPSGSGKSTLASALVDAAVPLGSVELVPMDALFEGWAGLGDVAARIASGLVAPLSRGEAGRIRTWDWHASTWGPELEVPPADLLVLEGVGSGSLAYADAITTLVWVEAPFALRRRRGLERDGDDFAPHWDAWMVYEQENFAAERTRERADLVVGAHGELVSRESR